MKNLLAIIISIIMIFSVGGQLTNSIYKNRGTESASKVRKSARGTDCINLLVLTHIELQVLIQYQTSNI